MARSIGSSVGDGFTLLSASRKWTKTGEWVRVDDERWLPAGQRLAIQDIKVSRFAGMGFTQLTRLYARRLDPLPYARVRIPGR